jgi:hypothetical protein
MSKSLTFRGARVEASIARPPTETTGGAILVNVCFAVGRRMRWESIGQDRQGKGGLGCEE